MAKFKFGNRAQASLDANITASSLTFLLDDIASGDDYSKFPTASGSDEVFVCTIADERILCFERSGQSVTVYDEDTHLLGLLSAGQNGRGWDDTTAASHTASDSIKNNVGAGELDYLYRQRVNSDVFPSGETEETFINKNIDENTLMFVVVDDTTEGIWSVESGDGEFTITSTEVETSNVNFNYVYFK